MEAKTYLVKRNKEGNEEPADFGELSSALSEKFPVTKIENDFYNVCSSNVSLFEIDGDTYITILYKNSTELVQAKNKIQSSLEVLLQESS